MYVGPFLEHTERYNVGGTAYHGYVTAETRSEQKRPPQRLNVETGFPEALDYGRERRHEYHIVDLRRADCGGQ